MRTFDVIVGFLGNCNYDTRSRNLLESLKGLGLRARFFGFDWLTPDFERFDDGVALVRRLKKRRPTILFYVAFFLKLTCSLLRRKARIYVASDFYALPSAAIAATLRRGKLHYDCRDFASETPALEGRRFVKRVIDATERFFIKRADVVFAAGEMDVEFLRDRYGVEATRLLNLPQYRETFAPVDFPAELGLPEPTRVLLYQGIVVKGRGIERGMDVVERLEDVVFVALGGGEDLDHFRERARERGLEDRVFFYGKIPQEELGDHTAGAFAGLSLIEDAGVNNYYALPNKLFEYAMAGVPALVSDLPQMRKVVEEREIGAVVEAGDVDAVVETLRRWRDRPEEYERLRANCRRAAEELNWEREFARLRELFVEK